MRTGFRRFSAMVLACTAIWAFSGHSALAQDVQRSEQELLEDFIHFVNIDNNELANAVAMELLGTGLSPTDFVNLVEDSNDLPRFERAIFDALHTPDIEFAAAALERLWEDGKLERVRNPDQIARNIVMLTGEARPRLFAIERLKAAGEYAMPQLLDALLQSNDPLLRDEVDRLMVDMGRQAVVPLCTALLDLDNQGQELVVSILGRIPYRNSTPFLMELFEKTTSDRISQAVQRAMNRLTGGTGVAASELFLGLARGYYDEKTDLTNFPGEEHQLFWTYDPTVGLFQIPVRTEVYHEAMAMTMAEKALTLGYEGPDGLSLWIAANFSREIDTTLMPGGDTYTNPVYASDRRAAMYFAVAAGAMPSQRVLGIAIDDRDTPLALRAIKAIQATAGGSTLWTGLDGREPLLEALRYPNRRVQYEAALALGLAQPTNAFEGYERVVPILASAIRDADARYALVIASDIERASVLTGQLKDLGYQLLPSVTNLDASAQEVADVAGVDLIVSNLSENETRNLIGRARAMAKLGATPILALMDSGSDYIQLNNEYRRDATIQVRKMQIGGEKISAAMRELVLRASGGPIGDAEARVYADRSLRVLRDLAVSQNPVLDIDDAVGPLLGVLQDSIGAFRVRIAEVLSRVDQTHVQVALMDVALGAPAQERVALFAKVADSAKRFGNHLEPRQVQQILDLAIEGSDKEATAAAALVGSLDLPNQELIRLILLDR